MEEHLEIQNDLSWQRDLEDEVTQEDSSSLGCELPGLDFDAADFLSIMEE